MKTWGLADMTTKSAPFNIFRFYFVKLSTFLLFERTQKVRFVPNKRRSVFLVELITYIAYLVLSEYIYLICVSSKNGSFRLNEDWRKVGIHVLTVCMFFISNKIENVYVIQSWFCGFCEDLLVNSLGVNIWSIEFYERGKNVYMYVWSKYICYTIFLYMTSYLGWST